MHPQRSSALLTGAILGLALSGCGGGGASGPGPDAPTPATTEEPRLVQAGAPGEASRVLEGASVEGIEGAAYTEADVVFMQGMIHHHAQALEMTALIEDRTETEAIRQMGLRMEISQADEIGLMERWLRQRGEQVPEWNRPSGETRDSAHAMDHRAMDHGEGGAGHRMPGMLTPRQMASLEAARGTEFDRLFLELMIQHHEGALTMVRDLYNSPGAAQESAIYRFASEVDADQDIEIRRMRQLLAAWR